MSAGLAGHAIAEAVVAFPLKRLFDIGRPTLGKPRTVGLGVLAALCDLVDQAESFRIARSAGPNLPEGREEPFVSAAGHHMG